MIGGGSVDSKAGSWRKDKALERVLLFKKTFAEASMESYSDLDSRYVGIVVYRVYIHVSGCVYMCVQGYIHVCTGCVYMCVRDVYMCVHVVCIGMYTCYAGCLYVVQGMYAYVSVQVCIHVQDMYTGIVCVYIYRLCIHVQSVYTCTRYI